MHAFMQAVNSIRLVLGTVLDVGEDEDEVAARRCSRAPSTASTATSRSSSTRRCAALSGR